MMIVDGCQLMLPNLKVGGDAQTHQAMAENACRL